MFLVLQAVATHWTITAESLSHVKLSRFLCCKFSSVVFFLWGGGGALCISCVLGQQVVFETQCTPVVTQFTLTVNADKFVLVERTMWQGFEAELAIQKTFFPYSFLLTEVCLCLPSTMLPLYRFPISQTTGWAEGHKTGALIVCQKKILRGICVNVLSKTWKICLQGIFRQYKKMCDSSQVNYGQWLIVILTTHWLHQSNYTTYIDSQYQRQKKLQSTLCGGQFWLKKHTDKKKYQN